MKLDVVSVIRCYSVDKYYYMQEALKEAKKAYKKKEVPVGAVLVYQDKIIARAHNLRERKQNVFTHAEVLAIKKANKKFKCWHLEDCELYVTLEPCPMCAGAIIQARLKRVYFGAYDFKGGCGGSVLNLFNYRFQNPDIILEGGILEEECRDLIKSFFKELRKK